ERRVPAGRGGRLQLADEAGDIRVAADVLAEEEHAADLAGADPGEEPGARLPAVEAGHDRLADHPRERRRPGGAGGWRSGDRSAGKRRGQDPTRRQTATWTLPATSTRTMSRRSSSTTTSAGRPTPRRPG